MVKNPKNKRDLIANIKSILPAMVYHKFDPGTVINLYLYEELRPHTLVYVAHNMDGTVTLKTIVDGQEYTDNIKEFDFSEIKVVLEILKKEKGIK